MTPTDPVSAAEAIRKAKQALNEGRRVDAREWAAAAVHLAPDEEEPWLLLAALASPSGSIGYLRKALEINPQSRRARQGMQWALARQQKDQFRSSAAATPVEDRDRQAIGKSSNSGEITQPVVLAKPATSPPVKDSRTGTSLLSDQPDPHPPPWLVIPIVGVLILCFTLFMVFAWPGWVAAASISPFAPHPADIYAKPSLTPTATVTATPTSTPLPTNTPTPQPSPTPLPTQSFWQNGPSTAYNVADTGRWIDVDLGRQMVYAYENDTIVNSFLVSTGVAAYPTVTGQYYIYVKYRYTDMKGPGYDLPDVPFTMYFYEGYALHGTYWHSNFGTPMSHGCINLRTDDAEWLYNWASVGTLVNIHP